MQDHLREKEDLQKDLIFYLEHYKELSHRSVNMRKTVDKEIRELIKLLKKLGK